MFPNVDMIDILNLPSKDNKKLLRQFPSIANIFALKIELRFEEVEKVFGFFIFEVKLDEKITFDHICNLIP
jgi:hypothetical protein